MYLRHITIEGERWDLLSWKYYQSVRHIALLIETNPHAPITETLPSGLTLLIPVIEAGETTVQEELPPWKR
ncbi:MAG: tail protein X [Duganella sp.]